MLARQAELIQVAQQHQREKDDHHMASTDGTPITEYPLNSYVLVSYNVRPPDKFTTRWQGPMQVINRQGSVYTVQNLITKKAEDVHISRLAPFRYSPKHTDPKKIAMHDEQEFLIETILSHRGSRHHKTKMEFLVKWTGFADTENSWEPWKALRDTDALHDYLRNNGMKTLLPPSAKT